MYAQISHFRKTEANIRQEYFEGNNGKEIKNTEYWWKPDKMLSQKKVK